MQLNASVHDRAWETPWGAVLDTVKNKNTPWAMLHSQPVCRIPMHQKRNCVILLLFFLDNSCWLFKRSLLFHPGVNKRFYHKAFLINLFFFIFFFPSFVSDENNPAANNRTFTPADSIKNITITTHDTTTITNTIYTNTSNAHVGSRNGSTILWWGAHFVYQKRLTMLTWIHVYCASGSLWCSIVWLMILLSILINNFVPYCNCQICPKF